MSKNVGLDLVANFLEKEHNRFLKAAESGMFCDTESCYKTANVLKEAINILNCFNRIIYGRLHYNR